LFVLAPKISDNRSQLKLFRNLSHLSLLGEYYSSFEVISNRLSLSDTAFDSYSTLRFSFSTFQPLLLADLQLSPFLSTIFQAIHFQQTHRLITHLFR